MLVYQRVILLSHAKRSTGGFEVQGLQLSNAMYEESVVPCLLPSCLCVNFILTASLIVTTWQLFFQAEVRVLA